MQKLQNTNQSDTFLTDRHQRVLNSMPTGYIFFRTIYDNVRPVDFVHEEVNLAYEKFTGFKNVLGRRLTEVLPGIAESNPEFFERLLTVAETGISDKFESYIDRLHRWYDNNAYRPEKGCLVCIIEDITEKKQLEQQLRKSEEQFKALFDKHSAIKILLDADTGNIIHANQAAADFYGWSVNELCRMHVLEITTITAETVKSNLIKMRSSQQKKFNFVHKTKNGSLKNVEIFTTRIEIDGKEVLYHIIQDITERVAIESELKESELRFRSLFADHAAIMIVIDPETAGIEDANQAAADFYGWSVEALRTMKITDLNTGTPEELQKEMNKWKKLEQRKMEFRHRKADGSIRDVEIFGKKIKINGKYLVYDIVTDVTARNRLETVSQMRIRLLKLAPGIPVNELLQATLDELEWLTESSLGFAFLVEENQTSFIHETYSTNTLQKLHKVRKKGEHYPLNNAGLWADAVRLRKAVIHNDYASIANRKGFPEGHVEVAREMAVPIMRNNKIVATFGIGNKLTNYDEEEIEWVTELADQAWDIIENKIKSDEQKKLAVKLQHASKMEMIGQLAAGIAHEINNPLNFITINEHNQLNDFNDLQELVGQYRRVIDKLLAGSADTEEVMQLREKEMELDIDYLLENIPKTLQMTQQGVARITAITKSMRNYSFKNEHGGLIPADINKAVNESLLIAKSEYRDAATIDLQLEELPPVMCDPSQISQVVLNLIINSAHAIKSQNRNSPGTIAIKTWTAGDNAFCSVSDDGQGIPEEIRSRIFEPFFTTKEHGKGTGLGLSISYDIIVNKHQGSISAECPPEGGTIFTLTLPLIN
ncbi:MAG: PAS domain S-box protein [Chlorobiaceae bacterium]